MTEYKNTIKYYDAHEPEKRGRKEGKTLMEYTPQVLKQIETFAGMRMSEEQIAHLIGVSPRSFTTHKKTYPEIVEAIDKGKAVAIFNVSKTAYNMATDGTNTTATFKWLNANAGWRESTQVEHSGSIEQGEERKKADRLLAELLLDIKDAKRPEPILLDAVKDDKANTD